ncbi:hypothetical protein [Spirosoma sp.]|uniref:hypothetical protein n=1 Tax=Spirosoma sp. TaxID=1899569 RepID=UPI002605159E|nr:hypothetical protein [Spirosoma sp.]MCX6214654.1 hypothetical protein [Spirosoma sp.]
MKNQRLNRAEKLSLLSNLMQGNINPLVHHKQQEDEGRLICIQSTSLDAGELVTNISMDRQSMPDMSRSTFEAWKSTLGVKGALVIHIIRRPKLTL